MKLVSDGSSHIDAIRRRRRFHVVVTVWRIRRDGDHRLAGRSPRTRFRLSQLASRSGSKCSVPK